MRSWFLPSAQNPAIEWLGFLVFLLLLFLCLAGLIVWYNTKRTPRRKRKHKHRHHHGPPTLDQVGGLPPRRELPPKRDLNQSPEQSPPGS
jgi:hypothetical protein